MTTSPAGGLLIVDKSAGMTSHDVVARVRRLAGTRKVGHAGTLDPAATGVLVLGINHGTKLLHYLTGADKTYRGTVRFGVSTTTDDAEGKWLSKEGCSAVAPEVLEEALSRLRGPIMQVPSSVSAIHIDGKRAYARVRAGEEVSLPPRPVTIYGFEAVAPGTRVVVAVPDEAQADDNDAEAPTLPVVDQEIEVSCSTGTYIRALARDLGTDLGCGAHLSALRRTCVGAFEIANAHPLAFLEREVEGGNPLPIMPLSQAATMLFPPLSANAAAAARFRHGQAPRLSEVSADRDFVDGQIYALIAEGDENRVLGLARFESTDQLSGDLPEQGRLKTVTVFQTSD